MPTLKDVTILAPSKEPQDLSSLFPGFIINNPVQTVHPSRHEELHYALCKAIDKIETPFFHIYDNDDPIPVMPETFPDVGIIFGDNIIINEFRTQVIPNSNWNFRAHASSPQAIHRAICRTKDAQKILSSVKEDKIYTEWWLYAHLAHLHGFHHDPSIKMYWVKHKNGLHNKSSNVLANTFVKFRDAYLLTA